MPINASIAKFLDTSPFAAVILNINHDIEYLNPLTRDLLCLDNEDKQKGQSFITFIPEKEHEVFINFVTHASESQTGHSWKTFTVVDSNDKEKQVLFGRFNKFELKGITRMFLLIGVPLSSLVTEKSITVLTGEGGHEQEQKNKYKNIFESATIGIAIIEPDGLIEEANPTFLNHFEISKKEIIHQHYSNLFRDEIKEKFEVLLNFAEKSHPVHAKDIFNIENNDNEHIILEVSLSKIDNDFDLRNNYMMITEDITQQEDTHAALLQSEKLALTGRLAASLAHEINNPLQTSIGCLGLAEELLPDDDNDFGIYIKMAMEELQRSARIVKKLRDLNRKTDPSEKAPVDLQKVINDVLFLTKNRFYNKNIMPVFFYQGPTPVVIASKDQVQQVVLNLIMNAIDALPNGGNIYLEICDCEELNGFKVNVRDTGTGMNKEVMANIFNPFFTTKPDGLGLGLYNCKKIVEDHDGCFEIESTLGKGTEVSFCLPGLDISDEEE